MKLVEFKTRKRFRYLWVKYVTGFDLSQHCARCLKGKYSRVFPFREHITEAHDFDLNEAEYNYIYICGVTDKYEENLHIVLVPSEETFTYDDGETSFVIEGATRIQIVQQRSYYLEPTGDLKEFYTCRNWQFAYQCVHRNS